MKLLFALLATGCLGTSTETASTEQALGDPPLVFHGGLVLQQPHVVEVLYGTGAYLPQIAATGPGSMSGFYRQAVGSGIYDWLGEYATTWPIQPIGRGSVDTLRQIFPTLAHNGATIDDSSIQAELTSNIMSGALPAPTDNTLYAIHFPDGKTIQSGATTSCGGGFCAFHHNIVVNGHNVFYSVVPNMSGGCLKTCVPPGVNAFDATTILASHELAEAITDPVLGTGWLDANNDEIADKCSSSRGPFLGNDGFTYTVTALFSNQQNVNPSAVSDCVVTATPEGAGPTENWGTAVSGRSIAFADVTGDGRADAIGFTTSNITVRPSTGSALGLAKIWSTTPFLGAGGQFVADVDGDGRADAIAVTTANVLVRRSTGTAFGPTETWTTNPFVGDVGTFFADVDHDGRADAIAVSSSNILVRRSTGTAFGPTETWSTNAYSGNVGTFFADVDGDGRADAIAVNSSNILVRRSTASAFGSIESWTSDPFFGDLATYIADVDGDGRADAIAINNNGIVVGRSGAYGGWFQRFGGNEAWTVTAFSGNLATLFADVTGDHKADAIAVDTSTGTTVRRSLRSRAP